MPVAVITGGSSGIGAATARALHGRGWRCVLLARGRERLETVAAEIGGEAEVCDVADRTSVDDAAARVAERHEAIGLLVLNSGIPGGGGFLELPPERIELVTGVNFLGSVWGLRAFLPLLEAGAPSDVVVVASVAGTAVPLTSGPYSASKHAQLAFARSVGYELAPRGIRMHAVNPARCRRRGSRRTRRSQAGSGGIWWSCPTRSRPRSCARSTRTGARSSRRGCSGWRARRRGSPRRRSDGSPRVFATAGVS